MVVVVVVTKCCRWWMAVVAVMVITLVVISALVVILKVAMVNVLFLRDATSWLMVLLLRPSAHRIGGWLESVIKRSGTEVCERNGRVSDLT